MIIGFDLSALSPWIGGAEPGCQAVHIGELRHDNRDFPTEQEDMGPRASDLRWIRGDWLRDDAQFRQARQIV